MRNRITITVLIIMCASVAFGFACGSASAPPIDLPAPITGRITISEPDSEGYVTVTGESGAVEGGSTVMAVNEDVAGTVTSIILNMVVKSAWAEDDSFPATCSEVGHACDLADENGAFVIRLTASRGDSIVFFLIDSVTGERISDISSARLAGKNCSGLGLTGAARDITVLPGASTPFLLTSGDDERDNRISVNGGDFQTISGCYADSIAVSNASTSGEPFIAATSKDDKIIWFGNYSGNLLSGRHFTYDYEPTDIVISEDLATAIAAMKVGDTVKFFKISTSEETDLSTAAVAYPRTSDGSAILGITRSLALDSLRMDSGRYLIMALTSNDDRSRTYLTLFVADDMTHIKTWDVANDSMLAADGIGALYDAGFWIESSDGNIKVANIGKDTSGNEEASVLVIYDGGGTIERHFRLNSVVSENMTLELVGAATALASFTPRNIVVSDSIYISETQIADGTPTALITDTDGYVWEYVPNWGDPASPLIGSRVEIAAGHDIARIALDDASRSIYAADVTGNTTATVDSNQFNWR